MPARRRSKDGAWLTLLIGGLAIVVGVTVIGIYGAARGRRIDHAVSLPGVMHIWPVPAPDPTPLPLPKPTR